MAQATTSSTLLVSSKGFARNQAGTPPRPTLGPGGEQGERWPMTATRKIRIEPPRRGSVAKACRGPRRRTRTRRFGNDSEKAAIAIPSRSCPFSVTARSESGGADQPGHEGGVLDRVPEPPTAPAQFVISPPRAHGDAEGREDPGSHGPRRDQRAQAASSLPESRADGKAWPHREADIAM